MRHNQERRGAIRGFTLLEIVVVIAVIGLLTAGLAAMLGAVLKSTKSRIAAENATIIQQSLQRFVERYGRLPCPAVPTLAPGAAGHGVEDTPSTSCVNTAVGATGMARGVVPWVSLGLPLEQVQDGYSRMFTYHVTIAATQLLPTTVGGMRGNMTVHSATPTALGLTPIGNQLNSCWSTGGTPGVGENSCNMNAVVILVAHGENGASAFTPSGGQLPASTVAGELENTDANIAFVRSEPLASGFDDAVYAWSPDDLLDPLARTGSVKSGTVLTTERVKNAAIAVSNFMVNSVTAPNTYAVPAAAPVSIGSDAWGGALVYTPSVPGSQLCTLAPAATVFTISSNGVDGVTGTNGNTGRNDDILVPVTVDLLRSQINNRPGYTC
jgi:prepilin-type N-terminal cleavage/methylation domain-containing protein